MFFWDFGILNVVSFVPVFIAILFFSLFSCSPFYYLHAIFPIMGFNGGSQIHEGTNIVQLFLAIMDCVKWALVLLSLIKNYVIEVQQVVCYFHNKIIIIFEQNEFFL